MSATEYDWTSVCEDCGDRVGHRAVLVTGPAWEHIGGDRDHFAQVDEDQVVEVMQP